MWAHYWRTFIPMQIFIVAVTAIVAIWGQRPWHIVVTAFVVMQLVNVISAWNAARLRRKLDRLAQRLPLER